MVLFAYGNKYLPNENLTDGIWCVSPLAKDLGFETGDKIITVDDEKPQVFSAVFESLLYAEKVTIERDGVLKDLYLPENNLTPLSILIEPRNKSSGQILFSFLALKRTYKPGQMHYPAHALAHSHSYLSGLKHLI